MENTATPNAAPFFRRLLVALGKTILFVVLSVLFILLLGSPLSKLVSPENAAALASGDMSGAATWVINLFYGILLAGIMLSLFIVRRLVSKQPLESAGFGLKRWPPELGEGWLLGTILVSIGYFLLLLTGLAQSSGQAFVFSTFMGWLLLFLIQPLVEEIIFRGFLMSLLGRYFNLKVALVVSSFAFALVHADNDGFSIIGFVTITLAGFLFGLLFMKTGQLWLATGMHAAWNFTQGVIFGFPTSGIKTYAIMETTTSGPDWLTGGPFGYEGSILAVLLIIAGIWWYRSSWQQEKLSAVMNLSLTSGPVNSSEEDQLLDTDLP